jgi:hypothetical protein
MSEEEKCRIRQIRAYADEYVNELENEVHSEFMQSIMKDAIEDAVKWADSHPRNKIEKDECKKLIEDEFNKLVCNKTISDFKLDFDNDVDENGILTVGAQIRLKEPVRYYTIKKSDFPGMTNEEFTGMCNEIKTEIENQIANYKAI